MIYRVDYVLAVILAGAIVGALLARRASHIEAARLARGYYILIAARVVLGAVVFTCSIVLTNGRLWSTIGSGIGDAANFLFGALLGLALFRAKPLELLRQPALYSALCLSAGFAFVTIGFAKAFHLQEMIEFFTQSGYSSTFLKLIMTAEVLGGAALLLPWAVPAAIAGLSIDMFGAIYTHIHNGDPLNDSTDAIAMLIRLGAIAVIWALRPGAAAAVGSMRNRFIRVGAGAAICVGAAVAGSALMRRPPAPVRAALPNAPQAGQFDYFLGSWRCAGTLARSGAPVEADLHFDKALDDRWLVFRHDDRPPNRYHALAEWSRGDSE
jgi:uncharacterized membrane protein YphA (DoxX/SURF4 family)